MSRIVEADEWPPLTIADLSPDALKLWSRVWSACEREVRAVVDADEVRRLSQWATDRMDRYRPPPTFDGVLLQPISRDPAGDRITLASIVDALPSHSPLVKRRLVVFLLARESTKAIEEAIVTIRGEVLE
ncbi:MAG: hypothetical protein ACF8PN_05495 [Phycisphaerales bacterium]